MPLPVDGRGKESSMDENEFNGFLARLNNVADEPNAGRPRAAKPKPYSAAADSGPPAGNVAARPDGWGGKTPAPPKQRAASPTGDDSLAYLNALTAIRVVFRDGRETVTTIQKVDEVIAEEKESRRRAARRVGQ